MSTSSETRVVNAAGLVQGIVLVTFPAAGTIFTDPADYDLSSTQYGALFLPQVITAITASLLGATLARRFELKRVHLAGLSSSLIAMLLLVASTPLEGQGSAFVVLLIATAFVGAGFGLTVPALNTMTAAFHPASVDRSVLVLNALLGLGTALAPVFVAVFVGFGFWWGLPVLSSALLVVLLAMSSRLPLRVEAAPAAARATSGGRKGLGAIPGRFWVFAAFAVMYGLCETMNGNWAQIDMTTRLGATTAVASLALTAFWAMVTIGRVAFAAVQRVLPTPRTYHLLPFLLAIALAIIAVLPSGSAVAGVFAFGLAGLGCSALLPLTISFGEEQLVSMSAAGAIIAFYQLGYGLAAFGTGPLQDAGVTLPTLFAVTAAVAVVMGLTSFVVTHAPVRPTRVPEPTTTAYPPTTA